LSVCFITDNNATWYSGGRYLAWIFALALKEAGFDVTIVTNRLPPFYDDFKLYEQPEVKVVHDFSNFYDNSFDLYFGVQVDGIFIAEKCAGNKPLFNLIFDVEPLMRRYGEDLPKEWVTASVWERVRRSLAEGSVICLTRSTIPYVKDWTGNDRVFSFYFPINSRVCDRVMVGDKKEWVVTIGRHVAHKHFELVVTSLGILRKDWELHIITNQIGGLYSLAKDHRLADRVHVHIHVNDFRKFEIIKQSKVLAFPSTYEGLGVPLMEALYCGIPSVVFEFHTFYDISDGKGVVFVKRRDPRDFMTKLSGFSWRRELWSIKKSEADTIGGRFRFENFVSQLKEFLGALKR